MSAVGALAHVVRRGRQIRAEVEGSQYEVEHRLTLEEVVAPEVGVAYPRIVAQNKPRYRYCQPCEAKRRKTVVTWRCLECSNAQQRDILVCEACLMAEHEDHNADEIVY